MKDLDIKVKLLITYTSVISRVFFVILAYICTMDLGRTEGYPP